MKVTHCNFPWPKVPGVPLIRIGFDVPTLLRHCVESITQQRQGAAVPAATLVPPVTEAEQ